MLNIGEYINISYKLKFWPYLNKPIKNVIGG